MSPSNPDRIGQFDPSFKRPPGFFTVVPRGYLRAASQQTFYSRHPLASEPEDGIALADKGGGCDHLSFSVDSPISASTIETIQKRITTVDSCQPNCSKWWWIGAILNTRLPVRL